MKALKTRSPIHLYYDYQNIEKVNLKIWIDKDISALNINTGPNYTLTSDAINSEVIFEISELLRSANQYEFEDDFYQRRDTAIYVLCEADLLDSNGDRINLQYNFLRVRDGYVQRNEQTQILKSNVITDFNSWLSLNSNISPDTESDSFGGNNAYLIESSNGTSSELFKSLVLKGVHTLSVYVNVQSNSERLTLKVDNDFVNFNLNNENVESVKRVEKYDILKVSSDWLKLSIVYDFSNLTSNFFIGFSGSDVTLFNPTIIKGDY